MDNRVSDVVTAYKKHYALLFQEEPPKDYPKSAIDKVSQRIYESGKDAAWLVLEYAAQEQFYQSIERFNLHYLFDDGVFQTLKLLAKKKQADKEKRSFSSWGSSSPSSWWFLGDDDDQAGSDISENENRDRGKRTSSRSPG